MPDPDHATPGPFYVEPDELLDRRVLESFAAGLAGRRLKVGFADQLISARSRKGRDAGLHGTADSCPAERMGYPLPKTDRAVPQTTEKNDEGERWG